MNLLMISGDRAILQGKRGPYWHTLKFLRQHWQRIDVIVPRGPQVGSVQLEFNEPGGEVWFHPSPRALFSQVWWIKKQGKQLLAERNYNVITAHVFVPFYTTSGVFGMRAQVPTTFELHGLPGYPAAGGIKDVLSALLSRMYLPGILKKATAVRVVNHELKNQLTEWNVPSQKIHTVPAIYLDAEIADVQSTLKTCDVVFCGKLDHNKGILPLMDAVASLPNVTLKIIGEGPLQKQVAAKLTSNMQLLGWLSEPKSLYQHIASAKCLVAASRYEGGPRVVFEAMACGTVPIVTPVGLAASEVTDGVNGVVTTGETDDIAACIQTVLESEEKRKRMASNATQVLAKYDRLKSLRRYQDFLQSVAA